MTKKQFKDGLNSELKAEGFDNRVSKVEEINYQTVITFQNILGNKLTWWVIKRFENNNILFNKNQITLTK